MFTRKGDVFLGFQLNQSTKSTKILVIEGFCAVDVSLKCMYSLYLYVYRIFLLLKTKLV